MRKTEVVLIIIIVLMVAGLGAYWWMNTQNTPAAVQPSGSMGIKGSPNQTNTGTPVVKLLTVGHDSKGGTYLVGANGMALYRFMNDLPNVSNCITATCTEKWPPYIVSNSESLLADASVTGVLSTIARPNGSSQLTYNGAPLYFWQGDTKAGDTTGDGVGGVWSLAKP